MFGKKKQLERLHQILQKTLSVYLVLPLEQIIQTSKCRELENLLSLESINHTLGRLSLLLGGTCIICLDSLMSSSQAGPTSDGCCFVPFSRLAEISKTRKAMKRTHLYANTCIHIYIYIFARKQVVSCMKSKPCKQILNIIIGRNASKEGLQTQLISV